MSETYDIIRFHKDGAQETIEEGLTREDAQAHCNNPSSSGEDWFDGFRAVECEECGHDNIHDPKYGCDFERGDGYVNGYEYEQALGPCCCGAPREGF